MKSPLTGVPPGSVRRLERALRLIWESTPALTVAATFVVVLQSTLPLLALYLMKLVVDAVATGLTSSVASIPQVIGLIGAMVAIGLTTTAVGTVGAYLADVQAHTITDQVHDVLHAKSVELDLAFYESPEYFDILHRAQREAPFRPTRILNNTMQVAQGLLTAVGITILIVAVHWSLAVLLALAVLPAFWVRVRTAKRLDAWQRHRAATERRAHYLDWLIVDGSHAKELRTFGLGPLLSKRFHELRALLRKERLGIALWRSRISLIAEAGSSLALFGSLAVIGVQTISGALSIGDLVLYFGVVQRGQAALHQLASGLSSLYEDSLFLAAADELLSMTPRVAAPATPVSIARPIAQGVEFRGVGFAYPGGSRSVLTDVNLTVRPGEIVAIVGGNGSGKTTLVKLLSRLYDPTAGSITIDGVDLRAFDPVALRREISVVFQDYSRYQMSVKDNLWFGGVHLPPDTERLRAAAQTSGAASVIARLPRGLDTTLGKWFSEGEELSVGEWQRIALARAFANDAQLLVLDEPTSSLDAEAELDVFVGLRRQLKQRGALLISHRFSSVRAADRIYVLFKGRVVEAGTHQELLLRRGEYSRLFHLQHSAFEGDDQVRSPRSRAALSAPGVRR